MTVSLPIDSYILKADLPFKNGRACATPDPRRIAQMANRVRACHRTLATQTWEIDNGPDLATKSVAYPTGPASDCITRLRVDLPQDLTEQALVIRGIVYAPAGTAGTMEDFQAMLKNSAGDATPWTVGPIDLAWYEDSQDQYIQFEMRGEAYPQKRLASDIASEEETWLNFYGTWTADPFSSGNGSLLHLTVMAEGFLTLDPDITGPDDVALEFPIPGEGVGWEWYNDTVNAQDLLYQKDTSRIIWGQSFTVSSGGYSIALTTAYTNIFGTEHKIWVPTQGRKYDREQVALLLSFYCDTAGDDIKVQWRADTGGSWADVTTITAAVGWNREEMSINVGTSARGILLRLLGSGTHTIKIASCGVRPYHENIMADII